MDDFVKASANKFHSCHAVSGRQPDPAQNKIVKSKGAEYEIPNGQLVSNPDGRWGSYNEFIFYDTKQVKMKYLVKV